MENLTKYINDAYFIARSKGFYTEDRDDIEYLAAIHEELSEAFQCWNKHKGWLVSSPKPDGIYFELTDAVIRMLSFCGYKGIDLVPYSIETDRPYTQDDLCDVIVKSHAELSQYYDAIMKDIPIDSYEEILVQRCASRVLSRFIARIELFIEESSNESLSLEDLITEKLAYNMTREAKHGGNNV
jgi:hypothetical protein